MWFQTLRKWALIYKKLLLVSMLLWKQRYSFFLFKLYIAKYRNIDSSIVNNNYLVIHLRNVKSKIFSAWNNFKLFQNLIFEQIIYVSYVTFQIEKKCQFQSLMPNFTKMVFKIYYFNTSKNNTLLSWLNNK